MHIIFFILTLLGTSHGASCSEHQRAVVTFLRTPISYNAQIAETDLKNAFFELPLPFRDPEHPDHNTVMNALYDLESGPRITLQMHYLCSAHPQTQLMSQFLNTQGATVCATNCNYSPPAEILIQRLKKNKLPDAQLAKRIALACKQYKIQGIARSTGILNTALHDQPLPETTRRLIECNADLHGSMLYEKIENHSITFYALPEFAIFKAHYANPSDRSAWLSILYTALEYNAPLTRYSDNTLLRNRWRPIARWANGQEVFETALAVQKKAGIDTLAKSVLTQEWFEAECKAAQEENAASIRRKAEAKRLYEEQAEKKRLQEERIAQEKANYEAKKRSAEEREILYKNFMNSIQSEDLDAVQQGLENGANPHIHPCLQLRGAANILAWTEQLYQQPCQIEARRRGCCGSEEARQRALREKQQEIHERRSEILNMLRQYQTNEEA